MVNNKPPFAQVPGQSVLNTAQQAQLIQSFKQKSDKTLIVHYSDIQGAPVTVKLPINQSDVVGLVEALKRSLKLPIATQSTLGGVIIGSGLTVTADGTVSSSENTLYFLAGQDISGHTILSVRGDTYAYYSDNTQPDRALGIATGAAISGTAVTVQTSGLLIEASWAWVSGSPVYLGLFGQLTQVVPASGYLVCVGTATTPTSILIKVESSIKLQG